MCRVWRTRVADAERLRYGRGILGAAALYATEGRMPTTIAHRGRQAARLAAWTGVTIAIAVLVIVATAAVAIAEAILSVL
jgi:hypothetical protein